MHCKDVDGLPASLRCFLHAAARASFPKWIWGFSDAFCFFYSPGTLCEGQEEGQRGLSMLFYGSFSEESSGNVTPAVLLLCSDREKREEEKRQQQCGTETKRSDKFMLYNLKTVFQNLLQHQSAGKLKYFGRE